MSSRFSSGLRVGLFDRPGRWVAWRTPLLALLLLVGRPWLRDGAVHLLTHAPGAHSAVKGMILTWQAGLARGPSLGWQVPLWMGIAVATAGRPFWAGILTLALGLGVSDSPWSALGVSLLLALQAAKSAPSVVAWIPGMELLFPRLVVRSVWGPQGRWKEGLLSTVGVLPVALLYLGMEAVAAPEAAMERLARWPDSRVDPRASVMDRVAPPAVFDFQDIDRVGEHVVVIGESPPRLIAYPLDGGPSATFPLRPFWENNTGMAVEVASDPATGRSWFLAGPHTVGGARYANGAWTSLGESQPLAPVLLHGAMFWFPESQQVGMITLNVAATHDYPGLIRMDGNLGPASIQNFRTAEHQPLPVTRDAVWIPPLQRFVLAPDFGNFLYLVDPHTGIGVKWMELSTLNGRMVWDDTLGRLFVARPERAEIAVVNPQTATIEKSLATEGGVRAIAVDATRGLVLTASVMTGGVEVLRLSDGARVDRLSGFMPMVRNLQVLPERGEAILSTWSVLYRFPYATP